MSDEKSSDKLAKSLIERSKRKLKAREQKRKGLWYGLGMFGLIGWSVSIPTVVFLALGIWVDAKLESTYSWTLMLLFFGIAIGCLNAWYWVKKESEND